jgi:hypothetical protein
MNDYISKPFRGQTLAAVLSRWLPNGQAEECVPAVPTTAGAIT